MARKREYHETGDPERGDRKCHEHENPIEVRDVWGGF